MDLKANKVDITPSSVSTTKLIANEWNQLVTENTNVITTGGGLTPSSKDRKQMVASIEKISEDKTKEVMSETYDKIADWVKPKDWIDIRSGALANSIYLLVGHSEDYSQYRKISFTVTVSTSENTYDVYVDGIKQTATTSGTATTLDWQTLALATGYNTTHPVALRTHIIRVTPTQSSDTLTGFNMTAVTDQVEQGILWMHFQLSNAIKIKNLCASANAIRNFLLESITAQNNKIIYTISSSNAQSGFYGAFNRCTSLVQIPVLEAANTTYPSGVYLSFREVPAKKIVIKNNNGTEKMSFMYNTQVQEFDIENGVNLESGTTSDSQATGLTKLRKFPTLNPAGETCIANGLISLTDTVIDDSTNSSRTLLRMYGSSSNPILGLKGLTVSNEAPFDYATSPQINISYTGLDRSALINLFNSLPYNVGYEVVGSPTIVDGVASGFSTSNYLKADSVFSAFDKNFEIVICTPSYSATGVIGGFGDGTNGSLSFIQSSTSFRVSWRGYTSDLDLILSDTFNNGSTYYFKIKRTGSTLLLSYSTDGINYVGEVSTTPTAWPTSSLTFRLGQQSYISANGYGGSIDLNQTYIKINGVTWFRGTATMTKTCNITGATGAASLDNTDLAIATSKGWTVTR